MPILAVWLGSLFTSIASFFATWLTKRLAIVAAVIAAALVFTAAFVAVIAGLYAGIVSVMPAEVVTGGSWIVPSNADDCIAAYTAGRLARWAYDWNVKVIQWKLL